MVGIAVAVAGTLGGSNWEPLDLLFGQVFSGPERRNSGPCGELSGFTMIEEVRCWADSHAIGFAAW